MRGKDVAELIYLSIKIPKVSGLLSGLQIPYHICTCFAHVMLLYDISILLST